MSVQHKLKDYTELEFAKTCVLSIWNFVHIFRLEIEREILKPASVTRERLLAALWKHAEPRA